MKTDIKLKRFVLKKTWELAERDPRLKKALIEAGIPNEIPKRPYHRRKPKTH